MSNSLAAVHPELIVEWSDRKYMAIYKQRNWQDGFNVNLDDFVPTMKSLDADKKASKTSEAAPEIAEKAAEKVDFSNVKIEPIFEEMVDDRIPAVNFCKTVNLILEENKIINQSQV